MDFNINPIEFTAQPTTNYLWLSQLEEVDPPADTEAAADRLFDLADDLEAAGLDLWGYIVRRLADDIAAMEV
ncbi:hypothetical protein O7630_31670 [Micromonospora sp. WMMD718]|uniref:hypothetical protein n=1 Tax=Micromonospora sp. WMMD718 TaxID=3016098 RepID=UPI00241700BD|nr:hypothetical protein [Micromonospora sp. WMMD718]MDG4755505.1 hypothetical protein [Micromonospora sp. WMMD718]